MGWFGKARILRQPEGRGPQSRVGMGALGRYAMRPSVCRRLRQRVGSPANALRSVPGALPCMRLKTRVKCA